MTWLVYIELCNVLILAIIVICCRFFDGNKNKHRYQQLLDLRTFYLWRLGTVKFVDKIKDKTKRSYQYTAFVVSIFVWLVQYCFTPSGDMHLRVCIFLFKKMEHCMVLTQSTAWPKSSLKIVIATVDVTGLQKFPPGCTRRSKRLQVFSPFT